MDKVVVLEARTAYGDFWSCRAHHTNHAELEGTKASIAAHGHRVLIRIARTSVHHPKASRAARFDAKGACTFIEDWRTVRPKTMGISTRAVEQRVHNKVPYGNSCEEGKTRHLRGGIIRS